MKLHPDARFIPTPIADLVKAILEAVEYCASRVQPYLIFPEAALNRSRYICVTFEFTYFFLHMMNRHALQTLGHARMASLQEQVGPLVATSAIETFYEGKPERDKDEIRAVFYD